MDEDTTQLPTEPIEPQDSSQIPSVDASQNTDTLTTITSLIQSYITMVDSAKKDLKESSTMLNDALNGDPVFHQAIEEAKNASNKKKSVHAQLMKNPTLAELSEKINDLRGQIKEHEIAMSDLLQQYAQMTGSKTFEDAEGNIKDIVTTVKLAAPEGSFKGKKRSS